MSLSENSEMASHEDIARRIADCLEQHLEEYGVELYRYPSGEIKGVDFSTYAGYSEVTVNLKDGPLFALTVVERFGKRWGNTKADG